MLTPFGILVEDRLPRTYEGLSNPFRELVLISSARLLACPPPN